MNTIGYEIKKILNKKVVIIAIVMMIINGAFYSYQIFNAGSALDVDNIDELITEYGGSTTVQLADERNHKYNELMTIIGNEETNKQLMISGDMTREEYTEYAVTLAKAKKMEPAWNYIMEKDNQLNGTDGWIIFSEKIDTFIHKGLLQPACIILSFFIAMISIWVEIGNGRLDIIKATEKGKKSIVTGKSFAVFFIVTLLVLIYYAIILGIMGCNGMLKNLDAPVVSVEINMKCRIRTFLCIYIMVESLVGGIIGCAVSSVCMLKRK